MFRSRRGRWLVTLAIAAGVFAALWVAFGSEDDDAPPSRSAAPAAPGPSRPVAPDRPAHPDRTDRPERPERPRLSEAEAIERVHRMTPWVTRGSGRGRLIALTFDDGPAAITPALLAELRRLKAPATFFPVGSDALSSPDLTRAEARPPFAIGSHTATHARLTTLGPGAHRRQILGGRRSIARSAGGGPRLFRPPYGAFDDRTLRILRQEQLLMVLWTFSAYDWKHPDTDYIERRVLRLARPGAIVLMHDGGGSTRVPTLRAVPGIVAGLRRRGYRLVTVPRLLRDAPPERRPPRPRSPYPG